ncbi:DUF4197 domain-containing protein [Mangrovibacterium lignilyticum]|uniref:DUF4197 domain-containing protein n=1 Tax=Mangrovibacterium lignilyticum TaxID=2668052 RepID=UPI0013D297F5|nr:DUF4197 domain-containing protein [Mangrovibacterium lignilyticum]
MKKVTLFLLLFIGINSLNVQAQLFKQLKSIVAPETTETDSTQTTTATSTADSTESVNFTESEADSGIKQALINGVTKGVEMVSQEDGYFGDELIKIPFPEEVDFVASKLRAVGMGSLVDKAVLTMNRAAEDAASTATDIFVGAIKEMTINDAINLVTGEENAATQYLQEHTTDELTEQFSPIIDSSLQKVDATKYWDDVMTNYNKLPMVKKVNPDLTEYVTQKAIDGLFVKIADQEKAIREDPIERTTDLLKKVFN